jgi:hypothetical protein
MEPCQGQGTIVAHQIQNMLIRSKRLPYLFVSIAVLKNVESVPVNEYMVVTVADVSADGGFNNGTHL